MDLEYLFRITSVAPSNPDYFVAISLILPPSARSPRLPIRSHLRNEPPYVILGFVATSILILIVARFSP